MFLLLFVPDPPEIDPGQRALEKSFWLLAAGTCGDRGRL